MNVGDIGKDTEPISQDLESTKGFRAAYLDSGTHPWSD